MSAADALQILGSPNTVSRDEEKRGAWVYEKLLPII